jgi:hypothetical protein
VFAIKGREDIGAFLKACGKLRHWIMATKLGRPASLQSRKGGPDSLPLAKPKASSP